MRPNKSIPAALLIVVLGLHAQTKSAKRAGAVSASPNGALADMIARTRTTIVRIRVPFIPEPPRRYEERGTGFFINEQGNVVTARHVVKPPAAVGLRMNYIEIEFQLPQSSSQHEIHFSSMAELVAEDEENDIAVLSVRDNPLSHKDTGATAATLDSSRMREGAPVFTLGHPLGTKTIVATSGSIASAASWLFDPGDVMEARFRGFGDTYMIDMKALFGNSGGPVFSLESGAVVGVAIGTLEDYVRFADTGGLVLSAGRLMTFTPGYAAASPTSHLASLLSSHAIQFTNVRPVSDVGKDKPRGAPR
jgi:S1-C subfamily serine protease